MKNHFGRLLLVAIVVGLSALVWATKGIRLGLDLKGGASLTYLVTSKTETIDSERVKRVIDVIEKRINATGLAEINITPTAQSEIVVELPGQNAEQIAHLKRLIERNGRLEFRIRAEPSYEREQLELRKNAPEGVVIPAPEGYTWVPQAHGGDDMLVKTPEKPLEEKLDRLLKKGVPEDSDEIKDLKRKIADVRREQVFTGDELKKTAVERHELQIVVAFAFEDARAPWFERFTAENQKQQMAIILDGKVDSAPVIRTTLTGGAGIIEGGGGAGFTEKEARDLAIVLESGSTGVNLVLAREEIQGPSLGEDAIRTGMWSVGLGLAAVVALMLFYYRLPGMVANLALVLNLVILMGALAFFRAALSLPGIAGIVLTLGMAVDANVLIFERFREERERGKPLSEAIAAGYDRALSAIVDGNATTVLTALVLIFMGTGSVKGFGVALTIGLLASMFTSILVTRWVFEFLVDKGLLKELRLGGAKWKPNLDYMSKRAWFTGPSIALVILGLVAYLVRDDYEKRDLEFVGGQEATIQLSKAISIDDARKRVYGGGDTWSEASLVTLAPAGVEEPRGGDTNRFRIRVKAKTKEDGEKFVGHIAQAFGDLLLPSGFSDFTLEPPKESRTAASFTLHALSDLDEPEAVRKALADAGFADVKVEKVEGDARALRVSLVETEPNPTPESVKTRVGQAVRRATPPVTLSDPFPSKSFLEKSRAEDLYRTAMQAVFVSLLFQVIYIRLRFADYKHGFAAVITLVHDALVTLGALSVADHFGLVYAKINLVVIASFLTLIGYSMNDTIVIFDRIRENLGRSRVMLSSLINASINETFTRSIRTSLTVFATVTIQWLLNRGTGSVLEGFAFVMVVGSIAGSYSTIFIASPLLLFLPLFWQAFTKRRALALVQVLATGVGAILAMTAEEHGLQLWVGVLLASNIGIQFLAQFVPWLVHRDPDSFFRAELEAEQRERPLEKPGI